jgi:hypothetical protein
MRALDGRPTDGWCRRRDRHRYDVPGLQPWGGSSGLRLNGETCVVLGALGYGVVMVLVTARWR